MNKVIEIKFVKMTGAGNDFVLIDNRAKEYQVDWSALAQTLCNRRFGVGADGLLIIEEGEKAPFRMLYYNADGSYGGMCGNGGRCVGEYLMRSLGTQAITFEALNHVYHSKVSDGKLISLQMKNPSNIKMNILVKINSDELKGHCINTGAPHAVFFVDDLPLSIQKLLSYGEVTSLGRAVRYSELFQPEGTNVNFVTLKDDNHIIMRTYERGVEEETLACGTGAVACAVISFIVRGLRPPITVETSGGEPLLVDFQRVGEFVSNVSLIGSAREVFEGSVIINTATKKIVNL